MDEDNLTIFRMKKSASAQLNRTFTTLISKQSISMSDVYEALGLYFLNVDVINSWTQLLQAKHNNYETYLSEKERLDFVADCVSEFAQTRERLDPTSRLLLGGSSPSIPSEITFWDMKFPDILINNFKKGGTYGCIYGLPRTGKTSLAVSLIELFIADTHLHIITNIVLKEQMEQVHFCPTLSELVRQMAENVGWVAVLDETATYVPRKRALSTQNIDFENLGRFIGKLGGRLILITHDMSRDVPPILQSWMTEQYRKTELTSMIAILNKPGGLHMNRIIANIPDCNLSFITEDITSLKFDISIKDLLSDIQTMKGTERDEQKNAITDWIDQSKKSKTEEKQDENNAMSRAETAYKMVNILLKRGITKMKAYAKVGKELAVTQETVRQYCMWIRNNMDAEDDEKIEEKVETDEPDENGEVDTAEEK